MDPSAKLNFFSCNPPIIIQKTLKEPFGINTKVCTFELSKFYPTRVNVLSGHYMGFLVIRIVKEKVKRNLEPKLKNP